jgi:hypothetical protein
MRIENTRWAVIAAILLAASGAGADTQVSGSWNANDAVSTRHADFSCSGSPTCTGVATVKLTSTQCSNNFTFTNDVTVTGLDLSHPGPLSGTYTISRRGCNTQNGDGTCTWDFAPGAVWPYTGTWDGRAGTLDISSTRCNGQPLTRIGSFTAIVPGNSPVFPMTVTTSITPTVASASALVQPRPQDVGRNVGIYVFAHAPSSRVKSVGAKRGIDAPLPRDDAGPAPCVLAQLNAQGQLAGVSASSMTAYVSGILSSQGQAVNILNNVPTSNVAGAAFFVGYGPTSSEMLATGLYQGALTVPGEIQCSTGLTSAPAPQSPGALTGLYWNASESGWGVHFTQRGSNIFAAWYTYDGAGKPKWYVAPNCTGLTGTNGTCSGTLYDVTAAGFFGGTFDPAQVHAASAGNVQVNFGNANNATLTYTVGAQTRAVAIVRQPLSSDPTPAAVDYTDLWWNPAESGWGMAIAQQSGIAFLAWYVYDASGKPAWLVATCPMSGSGCSGTLYRTHGPAFGPTFNPTLVQATPAGTISAVFNDANSGYITYTVDGVSASKGIVRQLF